MSTTETSTSPPVRPSASSPASVDRSSTMKMVGCRELFAEFYLDPTVARQSVAPGYDVRIHPNGQAMLLLLVQDCDTCVLNGLVRIRPMKMSHVWIELAGPEEIGPALSGTTAALPTSYWYAMPHQMDSALASVAFRLVGVDVQRVERVSLGGKPGGIRHGMVIEREEPTTAYRWEETSTLWPSPKLLTGRRWFYREYGRLIKRRSEGLVICRSSFMGEGEIRLEADRGSAIESLGAGRTLHGATRSVEIDCDVRIRVVGR